MIAAFTLTPLGPIALCMLSDGGQARDRGDGEN
jgi:hypothetical protein